MKTVFFEDGSVMTASRQCVLRRAIARKMSYEPMRYWFRACDEWVKAYTTSGEDEKVGQRLDEVYDEYSEANYAMPEAEERVEAIKEALEALRNAAEAIEWLGL